MSMAHCLRSVLSRERTHRADLLPTLLAVIKGTADLARISFTGDECGIKHAHRKGGHRGRKENGLAEFSSES